MPTSHTLTGDLSDVVGTGFPRDSVWVTIKTNLGDNPVFDTAGEQIRFPRHRFALPRNAQFSKSLWSTAALTNPTGYQYGIEVEWPDGAGGTGKKRWFSGWFSLTADKDMSELDYGPMVPPEYYPELTIARDEAVAAKTDAEAAQAAAEAAQAAAEAVGNTNDTIMAGVASDSGSAFSSVLSASTAAQIAAARVAADVVVSATVADGETYTIDPATGGVFVLTLTGDATLAVTNLAAGDSFLVQVNQDYDGGRTLTLPDAIGTVTLDETGSTFETLLYRSNDGSTLIVHQAAGGPYPLPYSPASITGGRMLLDTSVIAGDDGDAVSSASNGYGGSDIAGGVSPNSPTLRRENGVVVLEFDGTVDRMATSDTWDGTTPSTFFALVKTSLPSSSAAQVVLSQENGAGTSGDQSLIVIRPSSAANTWSLGGSSVDSLISADASWTVVIAVRNGAASEIRVDGGTPVTGTLATPAAASIVYRIGFGASSNDLFLAGRLRMVGVVGRVMSSDEIGALYSYLDGLRAELEAA